MTTAAQRLAAIDAAHDCVVAAIRKLDTARALMIEHVTDTAAHEAGAQLDKLIETAHETRRAVRRLRPCR